ncbi:T-complex 11 [Baffinella frigidus]|nr:T-complex 11 [Cryptophyta sp. CCMP2293]
MPNHMTNEQLTHELLIDETFRLDKDGHPVGAEQTVFSKVHQELDDAFWRSLEDDFRTTPPIHARCIKLLRNISNDLSCIQSPALAGSTYPYFSMEQVADELRPPTGNDLPPTIPWTLYAQLLRCLCDGVRDAQQGHVAQQAKPLFATLAEEKTSASLFNTTLHDISHNITAAASNTTAQPKVFVESLRTITDLVKQARITTANTCLAIKGQMLKNRGPEYLLAMTDKKIQQNGLTLDKTNAFIAKTIHSEVQQGRVQLEYLVEIGAHTTEAFTHVVKATVMSALFCCRNDDTFPETLRLDKNRFRSIIDRMELYAVVVTALGVLNNNMLENNVREKNTILCNVGRRIIDSSLRNFDFEGRTAEIAQTLSAQGMSQTSVDNIARRWSENLQIDSSTFKLSSKRLQEVLFRVFYTTSLNIFDGMPPYVLPTIGAFLRTHAKVLRRVLQVNTRVYSTHYNRIITEKAHMMMTTK